MTPNSTACFCAAAISSIVFFTSITPTACDTCPFHMPAMREGEAALIDRAGLPAASFSSVRR